MPLLPVPEAARSKAWVCGRSPAEILGSNTTGGMDVCLLWVLCVVRQRSLDGLIHSSRGVLPTVVRRRVRSRNLVNEEALAHWGLLRQIKKIQLLTRAGLWKSSEVNKKFSYSDRLANSSLKALLFLSQIAVILAWLRYPLPRTITHGIKLQDKCCCTFERKTLHSMIWNVHSFVTTQGPVKWRG
jgi:hypothetical protein